MKNPEVAIRLEEIRKKGDDLLEKLLVPMFIIVISLGLVYDTLLAGILLSSVCGALFLGIKYLTQRTLFTRLIMLNAWGLLTAIYIFQAHGQAEIRNIYYLISILFIIYQDARLCYLLAITAFIYTNGGYYLQTHGIVPPEYYYRGTLTLEFLIYQNLIVVGSSLTAALIANAFLKKTVSDLEKQLDYEKQMRFRENNIAFAHQISTGHLDADFESSSEDPVSEALLTMRTNLKTAAAKEQQDKFTTVGLAQMGEILRSGIDIQTLTYQIISHLVKYLKANQGGIFILQDKENDPHLELMACYAYERRKYLTRRIEIGEGLVGQAVQEGDTIFLTDLPPDYIHITSGLGKANPSCVLIVPLKFNEQIEGIVEIASFDVFEKFEIDFVEKLAESIASSLNTQKTNLRTRILLEDSQQQAEAMRANEEEMRQNMEELQAIHEQQTRLEKELKEKLDELEETKTQLEQVRLAEKARADEQIEKRNQIMKQTLEKFKQKEQELMARLEQQEQELQMLKNN